MNQLTGDKPSPSDISMLREAQQKGGTAMKRYEFTITLGGYGESPDEAWNDATEGFMLDPGATPDESEYTCKEIEEE